MKKSWIILVGLFTSLIMMISLISGVRVNEIELNPNGTDTGNEWIELYSNEEINLTGWTLVNNDDDVINLNQTFQNYLIINLNKQWLDNTNESVSLFNGSSLIDSSIVISDSQNNIKTWQYCSDGWNFTDSTKGLENSCGEENNNGDGNTGDEEEASIYLEIDWNDEDIVNGQDFEVEIKAFNLKDELYNLKVWIEFKENDTVISDRYDAEEEEWKSGRYYINDLFEGPGDETEYVELRIREDYKDFYGRAKIFFKIQDGEENDKYIEILEREEGDNEEGDNIPEVLESIQTASITGNVIKLGASEVSTETEDIKTKDNIVYESKTELIKKYAIYGFALLGVGICVLLGFKRLK